MVSTNSWSVRFAAGTDLAHFRIASESGAAWSFAQTSRGNLRIARAEVDTSLPELSCAAIRLKFFGALSLPISGNARNAAARTSGFVPASVTADASNG